MVRSMIYMSVLTLLFAVGCSDEAEKAKNSMEDAANAAGSAAEKMADKTGNMAGSLADKAGDAANNAGAAARDAAGNVVAGAENMAHNAADATSQAAKDAMDAAHGTASGMAGTAVSACRSFAEQGAWGQALEVCRKAHEAMPDDLALEHAYQQAQAAAGE